MKKTMTCVGLAVVTMCGAMYAEEIGLANLSAAEDVPPWVKLVVPGRKSLEEIFDWFDRVEMVGSSNLSFQLRRAHEKSIRMNSEIGSRDWEYISPAKPVVLKPGEKKHIWVEGVGIIVAVDEAIFPVEGCSWLSNAVHRIYVLSSHRHEFNKTTDEDKYVISPDLKKAFYLEGGKDVEYPFPLVSAKPNLTAEELDCLELIKGIQEIVSENSVILIKAIGAIVPNKRYDVKTSDGVLHAVLEDDGRTLSCADYSSKSGEDGAEVILFSHSPAEKNDRMIWLYSDGSLSPCDVVEDGKYREHDDESFKRAFARGVLTRLKLTAADLPGINLDAILGESEAKK